jgi:hypothetical protein
MANVTGNVKVNTTTTQVPATLPGTNTPLTVQQGLTCNFGTSGTTADAVDLKYTKTLNLVTSTPQTLDLTALLDVYGGTVNFKRVRSLTLNIKSTTNGQTLTVSPGATNGWTALLGTGSTLILHAATANNQAFLALTAPNTTGWVTTSSNKTLTFDPGAATFDVEVEMMGASV